MVKGILKKGAAGIFNYQIHLCYLFKLMFGVDIFSV